MADQQTPRARYLMQALYRYTQALESGDLETVATILGKAEHDSGLERMILEVNDIYQAADSAAVLPGEMEQVQDILAVLPSPALNGSERKYVALLLTEQKNNQGRVPSLMKTRPRNDSPAREGLSLPASPLTRKKRLGALAQSLVAAIMVCVLVGGFLAVFALHHTTSQNTHTGSSNVGNHQASPATAPVNIVTTVSSNGTLFAFRPDSGAILWHFSASGAVGRPVTTVIQNNTVYLYVLGRVYALKASNGQVLWQKGLPVASPGMNSEAPGAGSLFVDHGTIYLNAFDGTTLADEIFALRASDGSILWSKQNGSLLLWTESNGVLYLSDQSTGFGNIEAMSGTDGRVIWSQNTPSDSATVANGVLYVQSANASPAGDKKEQKTLAAFRAQDGHLLWSVPVIDTGSSIPVFANGEILINNNAHFCAYRASDGGQLWCTHNDLLPTANGSTAYTVAAGTLYASFPTDGSMEQVEAINITDGSFLWTKSFSGIFPGDLAVSHGSVFAVAVETLYALNGTSGNEIWHAQPDPKASLSSVAVP